MIIKRNIMMGQRINILRQLDWKISYDFVPELIILIGIFTYLFCPETVEVEVLDVTHHAPRTTVILIVIATPL